MGRTSDDNPGRVKTTSVKAHNQKSTKICQNWLLFMNLGSKKQWLELAETAQKELSKSLNQKSRLPVKD